MFLVFVMRPWVPKKWLIRAFSKFPGRIYDLLKTRDSDRLVNPSFTPLKLGIAQFYAPIKNLSSDSHLSTVETNMVNGLLKMGIRRRSINKDIVITTRDVFPSMKPSPRKKLIAEMRELHCDNPWSRQTPILGFPYDHLTKDFKNSDYRNRFEKIRNNATGLITYSIISKDSFVANGYPEEKIFIFPLKYPNNTVQKKRISTTKKTLFVGRDDLNKGLDLAVLITRELGVKLLVVGHYSISVRNWLQSFEHVEFKGHVNRSQLKQLMLETHAVIAPSVESYGLVVVEALESGCLVVSSNFNGAAATFKHNPNVYCSENLEIDNLLVNLRSAMQSSYNYEYIVEMKNYSTHFFNFLENI
jgi:glycosyltransferase involved in cell wall biosynthesis